MALSRRHKQKESLELISLVDMILILLVFFMVASFVMHSTEQEAGLFIPTPKNQPGEAQIFLQLFEDGRALWLDNHVTDRVDQLRLRLRALAEPRKSQRVFARLAEENTISNAVLHRRLDRFLDEVAQTPEQRYFLLIRCPDAMPYGHVVNIIASITGRDLDNVDFGCIGGGGRNDYNIKRIHTRKVSLNSRQEVNKLILEF